MVGTALVLHFVFSALSLICLVQKLYKNCRLEQIHSDQILNIEMSKANKISSAVFCLMKTMIIL